jgi:cytochrome o ubiquinol oxidase operon protein cyoD
MTTPAPDKRREIQTYVIGYGLALGLTAAAFAAVRWQTFTATATLAIVLGLAVVQMVVHFRFFLHVSRSAASRDNLWLILFSALIIALMVSGTLVVIFNLRQRMM